MEASVSVAHMRFTLVYLRLDSHHFLKPFAKTGASGGKEACRQWEVLCEVPFLVVIPPIDNCLPYSTPGHHDWLASTSG